MTNNPNITSKYEEERLRAAEQSQIVYLQGQIDELRRLIKDQTNRYNWAIEQVRKVEGSVAQIDGVLDRHRQEVTQSLDGYRRDITALRKEVANALIKAEESVKPLRELQAQIQQVSEARRQDRDFVASWLVRVEELEQRTHHWQSQWREADERHRALSAQLDGLREVDETVRADVRKIHEELQIEKQSLRRQAVEAQQLVADVRGLLEEHDSRITRLDEIRHQIELFAEQLPVQIEELRTQITEIVAETKRIERVSTERFLMNQERLEELRHQNDERVLALEETDEQHLRQLTSWLERVDALVHELEQRQSRSTARLELLQREQAEHLVSLERRDAQVVRALLDTVRAQYDQIHADLVSRGIEGEEKQGA